MPLTIMARKIYIKCGIGPDLTINTKSFVVAVCHVWSVKISKRFNSKFQYAQDIHVNACGPFRKVHVVGAGRPCSWSIRLCCYGRTAVGRSGCNSANSRFKGLHQRNRLPTCEAFRLKYFLFFVVIIQAKNSYAFLDFLGEQAKKATEIAAYADAVSELSQELAPDEDIKTGAKDIQRRSEAVRKESANLRYVSRSTQSVLNGPDWSSKRLETNIRSTTDYIRRFKRLIGRIAILGNEGAIALNTTETNVALNEVQRNQQTLILQNEDARLRQLEKESEDFRQWAEFSDRQRRIRKSETVNGKL